ncbi:MAG TPA: 50S ribosomal protein L35 [Bacillales bacterium]|nr:50S ribosomal protein L35 [Bacillales bacterium]
MPKMKTHKGAAKRFSRTGSGKIKRNHRDSNHYLRNKSAGQKRKMRHTGYVASSDEKTINKLLNS